MLLDIDVTFFTGGSVIKDYGYLKPNLMNVRINSTSLCLDLAYCLYA